MPLGRYSDKIMKEKDFIITMDPNMKVVVQCGINVSMGNQFLGMDKVNVKKTLIARIINRTL